MKKFLCLVACLALVAGCQRTRPSESAKPAATEAVKPAQEPAPAAPGPVPAKLPEVVARVNGEAISGNELEEAVRSFEASSGQQLTPDNRSEVYRGVLDDLVSYRLLNAELKTRQLDVDRQELDAAMKELRGRFPNEAAYRRALAEQKLTAEQLRERTRSTLLINRLLEQEVGGEISVSAADVAKFYEENPERFQQPEAVRLSHILIAVPQDANEERRAAARDRAVDLARRAREGANFAALAKAHSHDASRERGGDLGFVVRGQAQPAFEQAAFSLNPGAISDPVETIYGFHVIKAGEKRSAQKVPFGQAAAQVEEYLLEERRQEKAREFVKRLKATGKVEILI